ncbi:molybdenum cofactor guanylyltransferase [Alkalihalobacillus oceani]|uniref:molybdenum cofactor guanylyltransferase n=1 Tax=Halalkalibacter oceani TaxID=1653776 RepID=UPI00203DABEC|nr:molybdenum cofactor guanylyltransferase [Halalkalibacter oceani]MCM3760800.1 molybdenum cofactor guanylyltransferase [Halalkalibacter oceani]
MNIDGIVLAGGQSSRYGKPKMFEQYGGKAFYQHSVTALSGGGCRSVCIVTNGDLAPSFSSTNASVLIEEAPHQGPLAALAFAMDQMADTDWFFVLASDIPFVRASLVAGLIKEIDSATQIIIPENGQRLQPLVALYHRDCLATIKQLLKKGIRSFKPLLEDAKLKRVAFADNQTDFININYPDDLSEAKRTLPMQNDRKKASKNSAYRE